MKIPDIFDGKKILLGVTGGIAAYKSPLILREIIKRGAEARVIMTPSAAKFVTPLTMASLSGNPVVINTFPGGDENSPLKNTWHIDLAGWGDAMIIAPATVNTIAKIACGFADNALTTLVTALRCPLLISPSADTDMYESAINTQNMRILEERGYFILKAEEGYLASGLRGSGRLPEIEKILYSLELILLNRRKDLTGRRILITGGPTYEDIDPVRFIGNRSSGKTGFALAKAAYLRGADVTLITGPTSESTYQGIKTVAVRSANDMGREIEKHLPDNQILIMSAAVSDFKPEERYAQKIKKEEGFSRIRLKKNDDILSSLPKKGKIIIGFALETENEIENAKEKLTRKDLDFIVLNSLNIDNPAFESDSNKISIIYKNGEIKDFPAMSKFQIANSILDEIANL